MRIFISRGDGTFTYAPELVEGEIMAHHAVVVTDDFNLDGRADLAVFDQGAYESARSLGFGNPPQLFVSCPDGVLRPLNSLELAVRDLHARVPDALQEPAEPGDLHLKSATSGDIDADGDPDVWVESSGGANSDSHFIVNNGDGSFTSDLARAPATLLHNPHPEYWRHQVGHLVDIDNDDDLDLALGQMRDLDRTHVNQFSIVLVNDGTGHFTTRIELPHPGLNDGHTRVTGLTDFDVNGDGLQDLLLVHERNDDGPAGVLPFTGRYIQVLINTGTGRSATSRRREWATRAPPRPRRPRASPCRRCTTSTATVAWISSWRTASRRCASMLRWSTATTDSGSSRQCPRHRSREATTTSGTMRCRSTRTAMASSTSWCHSTTTGRTESG